MTSWPRWRGTAGAIALACIALLLAAGPVDAGRKAPAGAKAPKHAKAAKAIVPAPETAPETFQPEAETFHQVEGVIKVGTVTEDAEAEKQFEADMANTVSKKPERPAMDTYGTSHEDLEAAFQLDVARGRRVTVQPTKGLNAANAVDPDTTAAASANTATVYADAAAAAAAIADAEAEDDVITAAAAAKAAAAAAADAAFEAEAAAAAAAAAEAKDAAVAAAVAAAAAKKDTQMEFAFEDPERSAKSMKEDWGNDGWEEQLEGVDYLGAGLEDDDDAFAGSGGNYDYLGNGKLFGGDGDGGAVSSSSGSGVGLPDDDDTVEADEELDAAEWEFDALDDVDGSYDDDVDNVAEAFAQGEYDKASEVPSEDLDKAWGSGWAASDEDMDGSIGSHFKAAARAIETHVDVAGSVQNTHRRVKIAVAETMGLDPAARGNQLYLTLASLLPVVPVLFAVAAAARVIKQTITMYRAVQIANIYCASFCGMLVISGLFTHSEPLASYQFLSGNSQYVQYQLVVLVVFALYLILMLLNAMANAFWLPNAASMALALAIGIHYYFGVWHPAMLAQPPKATWGLAQGMATYTVYLCLFGIMALVPPKDAEVFHASEDKENGAGKAQD
eukprot:CAMPEP_0181364456 /NCGR_PEP_ID=MMETSP1106-20121128/9412_1 /TAXON_ID=81844 /ORGANISM="Mantoniella antarctica, Strain SL-175" /LENGTH=615 /DNA_ID=CAMNT_0023479203 /DNA_START=51 /DNA_END=1898 /DNA_ORIENTATION=+